MDVLMEQYNALEPKAKNDFRIDVLFLKLQTRLLKWKRTNKI